MIEVLSAGLEGVASFKKLTTVPLNKNPLTFVRGINMDSDPAQPTGNGAGKSLLLSVLPTVTFATPPTSKKKKAKKEVLTKKSAMYATIKSASGDVYEIKQTATKYKISKNGHDTEIRTTPLAEAEIRNVIFPLSEIEYYTHGYVSTLKPYRMHCDTNSERLEHLSSIFRLEDYAAMRQHFATKLRSVKDNEVKLSVLEQKALTLKDKVKSASSKLKGDKLKKLRRESTDLSGQIDVLVAREFELLKTKQVLKTLQTIEQELDDLRRSYSSKKTPKEYRSWLKEQRALVKEMESYRKLQKAYKKSVQSIQEKLDAITLPKKSQKELKKELNKHLDLKEKLKPEYDELVEKEKVFNKAKRRAEEALEAAREYGDEAKGIDLKADYSSDIAALRVTLKLQSLLDHEHDNKNECPTCLSKIDLDNIREAVARAKKKLPKLKRKIEIQEAVRAAKAAAKELQAVSFNVNRLNEVKLSLKCVDEMADEVDAQLVIWMRYTEMRETLETIKKPKEPKDQPATDMSYEQLDEQIEQCDSILSHVASKNKLLENNDTIADCRTVKAVEARIKAVSLELKSIGDELTAKRTRNAELASIIEKHANREAEFKLYTQQLEEVQKEIAELRPGLGDKKILEVLIKAYSTKGLKTVVANQICSVLQANLNLYRPLVFLEPYTFTAVANESGLALEVDRGKDHVMTDVRSLSGAESDCFCLLFLLAILPMIPSSRRLSMVTLDEPTSHCDAVTRRLFIENYLPALCEMVPHVYVITNNPEDYRPGSAEWTVVKRNGKSVVRIK